VAAVITWPLFKPLPTRILTTYTLARTELIKIDDVLPSLLSCVDDIDHIDIVGADNTFVAQKL
jgi:hypothetical protein